jgi:hypothetical protein
MSKPFDTNAELVAAATARSLAEFGVTPPSPDAKLNRDATAQSLTALGYKITPATLATKATRGGGPPFFLWGRKPLYRWGDALAWAEGRLSKPVRSTSELEAA